MLLERTFAVIASLFSRQSHPFPLLTHLWHLLSFLGKWKEGGSRNVEGTHMQHISDQMLHVMYWIFRLEPGEKPSEEGQPSCGGQHSAGATRFFLMLFNITWQTYCSSTERQKMTEISNRSKMWYLFPATAPASQTIQEKSEQDTRLHVTDLDNTWSMRRFLSAFSAINFFQAEGQNQTKSPLSSQHLNKWSQSVREVRQATEKSSVIVTGKTQKHALMRWLGLRMEERSAFRN